MSWMPSWPMGPWSGRNWACIGLFLAALGAMSIIPASVARAQDADRLCDIGKGRLTDRNLLGTFIERQPPCTVTAFTFTDADGTARTLADFKGQALVVNLWATWCPPCVREMPSLNRLQAKLGSKDFAVLAISQDMGPATLPREFLEARDLGGLAFFHDPKNTASKAFATPGLPITLLIDREGREVARVIGPMEWDEDEVMERIRTLLDIPDAQKEALAGAGVAPRG